MQERKFDFTELGRSRRNAESNINQALATLESQSEEYLMKMRNTFITKLEDAELAVFTQISILNYFDVVMVQKFALDEDAIKMLDDILPKYAENSYHRAVILVHKAQHMAKLDNIEWLDILDIVMEAKQIFDELYKQNEYRHIKINIINCAYSIANICWQLVENGDEIQHVNAVKYYQEAILGSRELHWDSRVELYSEKMKNKFHAEPGLAALCEEFYQDLKDDSGPWSPKGLEKVEHLSMISPKSDKLAAKDDLTLSEVGQLIKLGDRFWNAGKNLDAYNCYTHALRTLGIDDEESYAFLQLLSRDKYSQVTTSILEPEVVKKVSFVQRVQQESNANGKSLNI